MKGLSLDHPRTPWMVSEGDAVMDDEFGFFQARASAWVKVLSEWFHLRRLFVSCWAASRYGSQPKVLTLARHAKE